MPPIAAVREVLLVQHLDGDTELCDRLGGACCEIGRTEPFGRRRHEVLHERGRFGDGHRRSEGAGILRRGAVHDDVRGARLGGLCLVAVEAVAAERGPFGRGAPQRGVGQRGGDGDRREARERPDAGSDGLADGCGGRVGTCADNSEGEGGALGRVDAHERVRGAREADGGERFGEPRPVGERFSLIERGQRKQDRIGVRLSDGACAVLEVGESHGLHPRDGCSL